MASLADMFEDEEDDEKLMSPIREDKDFETKENSPALDEAQVEETLKPIKVAKPKALMKHQSEMWDVIDSFEDRAWSGVATGIPTGISSIDDAFDGGLQTGWVIIGGQSNIGKTSFISQIANETADNNPDSVYVLDFSLDDPMHDKIPRIVASRNRVIINAVKNPVAYAQYPAMLQRREQGIKDLRDSVNRYRALDANHSTDIDAIEETIKKTLVALETEAQQTGKPRRRLVVFIDNFHDLTTSAKEASQGDKNKYDYLAQRCADIATRYDIPLITSGEFKKLGGFRRPGVDDLRESIKIVYEAKAILLCYNEVGLKGESSSIYFDIQGRAQKQPVFEVKFGKNKLGGFKGRIFFEFYPEIARFEECDAGSTKRFNNLIYSNE